MPIPFRRFESSVIQASDSPGFIVIVHPIGLPKSKIALAQCTTQRLANEFLSILTDDLVHDAIHVLTKPSIEQAANTQKLRHAFGVPEAFVEPVTPVTKEKE